MSSLPLLLYISFLFLFARAELINTLPQRFQNVTKALLLIFIPGIIVTSELGSFLGIEYLRKEPLRDDYQAAHLYTVELSRDEVLLVGFRTSSSETLWSFFTSISLALFTAYQAINFVLALYRLMRVVLSTRKQEEEEGLNRFNSYGVSPSKESMTTRSSDKITLFKGTAWILAGVKLGAVETVVGFVTSGGFGVSLTRRVLRMLSRAFIIIGLAKGLDTLEDFELVKLELDAGKRANRQSSQIRNLISNPRLSTFHRLSPSASDFRPNNGAASLTYNDPVPPPQYNRKLQKKSSRSTFAASPIMSPKATLTPMDTPTMADFAKLREIESGKRVTIRRANSGVPTLHMRLSSYDLPSPNTVADSIKSRPLSDFYAPHQPSVRPTLSIVYGDDEGNVSSVKGEAHYNMNASSRAPSTMNPYSTASGPPTPSFIQRPPSSIVNSLPTVTTGPSDMYTPSFIQRPPPSTINSLPGSPRSNTRTLVSRMADAQTQPPSTATSATFSFLASPPAQPPVTGTPTLLLRSSMTSFNQSGSAQRPARPLREKVLNPWPESNPHPYARAGVGDYRMPLGTLTVVNGASTPSDGSSTRTVTSNSRPGLPATVKPAPQARERLDELPAEPASETGHSDSTHSLYSQASHQGASVASHGNARSDSMKRRKAPPPVSPILTVDTTVPAGYTLSAAQTILSRNSHSHTPIDLPQSAVQDYVLSPPQSAYLDGVVASPANDQNSYPAALNTGRSQDFAEWKLRKANSLRRDNEASPAPTLKRSDSKRSTLPTPNEDDEMDAEELRARLQKDAITVPWLRDSPKKDFEIQKANRVQLTRIKSIGRAPRRSTPTPVRSAHARDSMYMSVETLPQSLPTTSAVAGPRPRGSTLYSYDNQKTAAEVYRDSIVANEVSSSYGSAYGRGVLRDSEVLGLEADSPVTGRHPFSRN
ncbi:hypothetical protein PC9H_000215 [Pleurotus ostreatus]|uniref:Uncharacterized protein n=1 Tax=Pleurotus ostreatus TaxID=5322 RepID=A0A8H7A1H1_PLEOS|nr:uncharacterized protein PC9H_000215 [Pleurotus ostreatus]KAF7439878.1 hypothetical protein PC9H_000215 [Pleurotus ostreatus]